MSVHPVNPDIVFAAYGNGGLWWTLDGGATWKQRNDFRNITVGSVRICPTSPNVVIAGLGDHYDDGIRHQDTGVLKSTDGGATWQTIGPAVSSQDAFTWVECSINDAGTFYAASETALYKTSDGGATWTTLLNFRGTHDTAQMPTITLHPTDPNTMLVEQRQVGIMRTSDAGLTWRRVDGSMDQTNPISLCDWSKSNTSVVYCLRDSTTGYSPHTTYTYRSSDGGLTWSQGVNLNTASQGRYDMAIAVDPSNENRVLVGLSAMDETLDGFQTYHQYTQGGFPDNLAVVFAPSNPQIVYNGNDDGLYKSTAAGKDKTWSRFDVGVATNKSFGFAVVPQTGLIYLSPEDYGGIVYRPGSGWVGLGVGDEYAKYYVNPHDPTDVYETAGATLYRVGAWNKNISPDPNGRTNQYIRMAFDPVEPNTIYTATGRVWKSADRGTTWTLLGPTVSQLPEVYGGSYSGANYLAVAPSDPKTIFAQFNLDGRLWRTTDGGLTWTGIQGAPYGAYSAQAIAVMPDNPQELFFGTISGLYHSADGGFTTARAGTGLPAGGVRWIVVDPALAGRIFAGTDTVVFVSLDRGVTWAQLGTALPPIGVNDLELADEKLYVANLGQSLWELDLPVPRLKIVLTRNGTFALGQQNATYTVTVSNSGTGPSTGLVTVTDAVPAGLTLVSMTGNGWSCSATACTRGDALAGGSSYPPITVTVNVAANPPSQLINQATVSGGGSLGASATDQAAIYSPPPTGALAGVLAYWPADNTASDVVSGLSGTLVNGAAFAPGIVNQAFSLNGVNSYVRAAGSAMVSGPRTLSAWVYPNGGSGLGMPILTGGTAGAGDFLGVTGTTGSCSGSGQYRLYVDHWGTPCFISSKTLTPNVWSHVVVTYDAATIQFYINGVASQTINGSMYNYGISTYEIGGNTIGGTTTKPSFNGLLDEIQIYSRPLSQAEIQALYSWGLGGRPQPSIAAVVNGANFKSEALSAGAWISILGQNLGQAERAASANTLTLGGASVSVCGIAAILSYNSGPVTANGSTAWQLNALLPDGVAGQTSCPVIVNVGGQASGPVNVTIAGGILEVFQFPSSAGTLPIITHADYSLVGPASAGLTAASPGETVIVWGTGDCTNPGVTVAGTRADVVFSGRVAPGLCQLNFLVPNGVSGGSNPLEISTSTSIYDLWVSY